MNLHKWCYFKGKRGTRLQNALRHPRSWDQVCGPGGERPGRGLVDQKCEVEEFAF